MNNILIEKISSPILVIDNNKKCINSNKLFLDLINMKKNEIIGLDYSQIIKGFSEDKNEFNAVLLPFQKEYIDVILSKEIFILENKEITILTVNTKIQNKIDKDLFNALFNNDLFGTFITDKNRNIKLCNNTFANMAGYKVNEIVGKNIRMFYSSNIEYEKFNKYYDKNKFQKNKVIEFDFKFKNRENIILWASISGIVVDSLDDNYIIWIVNDITKRINILNKLKSTNDELESIFNNSVVGIIMLKGGRKIYRANEYFSKMFGYNLLDEISGKEVEDFHVSKEKFLEFGQKYYNDLVNHSMIAVDYQFKKVDGSIFWISIAGKAIDQSSPPDLNKGVIWTFSDIDSRKNNQKLLEILTTIDELTGVYNRRYFMNTGKREVYIRKRSNSSMSLFMLDIDYFKEVNDEYGHAYGDATLINFCNICKKQLRISDIFARMGGEEFAVLLPNTDLYEATKIAERIRVKIESCEIENIPRITVSIGIALTKDNDDMDSLLKKADKNLYKAKKNGRNCIIF